MGYCNFKFDSDGEHGKRFYRCRRCFRRTPHAYKDQPERVFRKCARPGLGEVIASFLSEWGITKDRWSRWQSRLLGREIKCRCSKRASALDQFGDSIIDWLRTNVFRPK